MSGILSKKVAKVIPVWLILLTATLVSASVLTYYAVTQATITVKSSISISQDGQNWQDAPASVSFDLGTIVAGETKTIDSPFYIRNNLPVEGSWDYVYFDYKYTFDENLLDGLNYIKIFYTTYPATDPEPDTCDKKAVLDGATLQSKAHCDSGSCYVLRNELVDGPDKLGEGMIQKFCGFEISLKPNAIRGTYSITTEILPVEGE